MKAIDRPAWRLTADCIWNSFRSSGKKHLFLTGDRGSGKTVLFRALGAMDYPGLTSHAERGKGVWLQENGTGLSAQIGSFDPSVSSTENRMRQVTSGFETLGIPALKRCMASQSEWIAIDEIGYLETEVPVYCQALLELMENKCVIAVLRKQDNLFLSELRGREDAFTIDMDEPFGQIGCVIMASGLGKRYGGNKLMIELDGEPMIAHVLEATADVPHRVVVTRHKDVAAYCEERGVQVILHELPLRSDTVRLGMQAMAQTEACMFCPGDQPRLSRETVNSLMLASMNSPEKIWRTAFEGESGAPVLFPVWAYAELENLPDGWGGGYIAKKHPEQVDTISVRDACELMDIDTPEDLGRVGQYRTIQRQR